MTALTEKLDRRPRWRARLQIIVPSLLVLSMIAVSAFYADSQQRQIDREYSRDAVQEQLGTIRTKLEGNINANVRLLQGLVAVVSSEPYVSQQRFAALAENLLANPSQIRNIAAAPDLITAFVYPYERNRGFIGKHLFAAPENARLLHALKDGQTVIIGPNMLNNGTQGLVVALPVRIVNDKGDPAFWGGLIGVIDLPRVYDDSGLLANDLPLRLVLAKKTAHGSGTSVIFGDRNVLDQDPIRMVIDLGNDQWTIAAIPQNGWGTGTALSAVVRLGIFLVASMIAATVIWVALLMAERQKNYAALREREEQLTALSSRLGLALETSSIGIWELDLASGDIKWDDRMYQLYGVDRDVQTCYDVWRSCVDPDDLVHADKCLAEAIAQGKTYETQFRITRDGEIRHIRAVGTAFRNPQGRMSVLGVNWDVSADVRLQEELREAQRQTEQQNAALDAARLRMEHNSLHDALTGLPNRRFLDQKLAAPLDDSAGYGQLTILHLDLDRFKEINDTLGHGAGDAILRHVATELEKAVTLGDFVARIGGDEFVVVCTKPLEPEEATRIGERLIAAINRPIVYNDHECRVGASIGIAIRQQASVAAEQLLVNADIALYEAKRRGRNRVEHFNDSLRARTINVKQTADAILRSLGNEDFIAYYQPQFDANTLQINGAEALARWNHPKKGILTPDKFLEIAESLNVVSQIDASILEQALAQLSRWRALGLGIEHVSVNISAQRLFEDKLIDRLETLALKPGSLSFELLESISFDDKADAVAESLERIRAHGIAIEIDDFGTGYASILSLIKLSPSRLKIDRQLVAPIVTNATQRRLISSIVDIGRSFGVGIVAEGVETMEHAAILRDLGCQTLQGYALARPMSPDAFVEFALRHAAENDVALPRTA
ncbi:bifunctional diguanylate cyclase/phosphodiesterase [Rhizobium wuzhouense]|uniref:Bifunctional diguanylate cyclase/phosphodiesterase n=1 Tax=Rhizobium wuzhouense TaxID=1986026 RepID=A0ABX5NQY3_9HYPH|nr:EAL domain-containing protein [Rhizobium wuzhouense]PYB73262.1 bifunctional diguanylate cyclase/phosphodiesterase [Rhizobium wuzhouense]